eukprot:5950911-Amphidinium_carterae.1
MNKTAILLPAPSGEESVDIPRWTRAALLPRPLFQCKCRCHALGICGKKVLIAHVFSNVKDKWSTFAEMGSGGALHSTDHQRVHSCHLRGVLSPIRLLSTSTTASLFQLTGKVLAPCAYLDLHPTPWHSVPHPNLVRAVVLQSLFTIVSAVVGATSTRECLGQKE